MNKLPVTLISIFYIVGLMIYGVSAADTIKVGIELPLTEPQAKFAEIEKNSFDLALEEINVAGGINKKTRTDFGGRHRSSRGWSFRA